MANTAKVVDISTKQVPPEKNAAAVALGRLGGLKGGNARAAKLDPAERKRIAQQAAKHRWANRKKVELEETTAGPAMVSKKVARQLP